MTKPVILALFLASAVSAAAQDSVVTKFLNYRKQVAQEKMFVHTDRDVYLTGETIWLKIYTVDASLHAPIDVSSVAYLELVDKYNQSVVREKITITNGIGSGTIFLPASIESGNYLLRGYTNWMKNFGADYFFKKTISVVNSFVKLDQPPVAAAPEAEYDVQLFPEGGSLLADVENKVGIKVNDRSGRGISFRGALIGEGNDTIARFNPAVFGMSSFDFTPVAGKKYHVVVNTPHGRTTANLPDAASEGYAMRVTESGDVLNVEVSLQPMLQTGPVVFLLAHTRQQVAKAERKTITKGKAVFQIQKKDLKDGVSHLTVFDAQSRPVAERLYFKVPTNSLDVKLASDKQEYQSRSKVTMGVETGRAVQQMSISVFRLDSIVEAQGSQHISEFLYLTSDLQGLVESPGYYFSNSAEARAAADNLMLTQGWRRFNWQDVFKAKRTFTYAPEVHGHMVKGIVKDLSGNPAATKFAYVTVPGKVINMYPAMSNRNGEIYFEVRNFIGNKKVLAVVDSAHRVELFSPFSTDTTHATWPALRVPPSTGKNLLARSVGMQVQKIYYDESYVTPEVDSSAFYGKADETYFLDDYTRFPVMEEVMREYVPGVMVRKQRDKFRFILLDDVNKRPLYDRPMILLDGVPVFDVDKVMAYDPLKVKKLEVVTRNFYHGVATFPGIVSYSTYQGDLDGFELDAQYVQIAYAGLQLQREFYSPRHEYTSENEARLPDQRSLLFWDATLATDNTGKQETMFFTSDVEGTYQVVVEGLTSDGRAGFATQTFRVKGRK